MTIDRDQLAQYRGCWPENECYHDCCEAAQYTIDNRNESPEAREEIDKATVWAAKKTWI